LPATISATSSPSFFSDVLEALLAALILGGVVQEGGDDLVLGPAVLTDDGGDREQVGYVRDLCPFPSLIPMHPRRVRQGFSELLAVGQATLLPR
jgi:hypothetical protein